MPATLSPADSSPQAANGAVRTAAPGRYLIFSAGGDAYGLHVRRVREIIHNTAEFTRIPRMPAYVRGCLNLRGTVIPVVDLRTKFQVEAVGNSILNCIIVSEVEVGRNGPLATGLIVDSVEEVVVFKEGDLEPAPEFGGGLDTRFVQGMAKHKDKLVALLELNEVIAASALKVIKQEVDAVAPEEAIAFDANR